LVFIRLCLPFDQLFQIIIIIIYVETTYATISNIHGILLVDLTANTTLKKDNIFRQLDIELKKMPKLDALLLVTLSNYSCRIGGQCTATISCHYNKLTSGMYPISVCFLHSTCATIEILEMLVTS